MTRHGVLWGLGVSLFASVALNLLLVGFVAGDRYLNIHARTAPVAAPAPGGVLQRVQDLPPEERQRFREAVKPHRAEIEAMRTAQRAAQAQLAEAVRTDPYDEDAVRAAFARVRETTQRTQEAAQQAAAAAFAVLSRSSRELLATPGRTTPR